MHHVCIFVLKLFMILCRKKLHKETELNKKANKHKNFEFIWGAEIFFLNLPDVLHCGFFLVYLILFWHTLKNSSNLFLSKIISDHSHSLNIICSTYKNTPPTSSTRISIKSFTECLHQIFTVHRTHRWRRIGCCGTLWLRYGRRCRRSTCWWSISFGHVKGHSHFWLITFRT